MRFSSILVGVAAATGVTAAVMPRAEVAAVPVHMVGVTPRQAPDYRSGLLVDDVCRFFYRMASAANDMYGPAYQITATNGAQLLDKGIPGEKTGPFHYIIQQMAYMMGEMDAFRLGLRQSDPFSIPVNEEKIESCLRGFVEVFNHLLRILIEKAILFRELGFVLDPVAGTLSGFMYTYDAGLYKLKDLVESQEDKEDIAKWTAALKHNIETAIMAYKGVLITGQGSLF